MPGRSVQSVYQGRFYKHLQRLSSTIAAAFFRKYLQELSAPEGPNGPLGRPVMSLAVVYSPLSGRRDNRGGSRAFSIEERSWGLTAHGVQRSGMASFEGALPTSGGHLPPRSAGKTLSDPEGPSRRAGAARHG
jgi:hypothetical protein